MSNSMQAENAYSYVAITAITEKRLNEFLAQAKAAPENTEKLLSAFSATFQLWFDITQQDPTPQQEKDGPRFLDLIPQFPETGEDQAGGSEMRTVSVFKNGNNRAIRLPRDMDFEGVNELEIVKEGNSIILRPVRPSWRTFTQLEKAEPDFLADRENIISDEVDNGHDR